MTFSSPAAKARLESFSKLVSSGRTRVAKGSLSLGVDLGTANIVLSVVDSNNKPIAGASTRETVVRDGVVVDWIGAVQAVRALKEKLEQKLNHRFETAAVTIPPAIDPGTIKVFTNVVEACQMDVREIIDEPVAAARALGLRQGCVVDVGHGTTGVSVIENGETILSVDEATGGHHMNLVISGALGISYEEAEKFKKAKEHQGEVQGIIRPTLTKMATIARDALANSDVTQVHLVGGSSSFECAGPIFESVLGIEVICPPFPLWVTPLGSAMLDFAEADTDLDGEDDYEDGDDD